MNERRKWITLFAVGLLVAACAGGLIYMKAKDLDQARLEVTGLEEKIEQARSTIQGTAGLEREVVVLREMSEVIETILPNNEDVNNLIRTFHDYAKETGVRTTSYKKKADNTRGSAKADFDKVAYTLTLEGDTFQFMELLTRIENHTRFMAVPYFKLTSASPKQIEDDGFARHKFQLDVETYRYEPGATQTEQAKIEGYQRKRDLLAVEINRRRQALTLDSYTYRGPRGRRDPWIDPRVPAMLQNSSQLTVQEQMDLVDEMRKRMVEATEQWGKVEEAGNVLEAMIARTDLEELLAALELELRRVESEGLITYVPAQKRLKNDVYDALDGLRQQVAQSTGMLGPSREMLEEVFSAMGKHIEAGEYTLALKAYGTVENDLHFVKGDPVRTALANRIRQRSEDAKTLRDFEKVELTFGGVAIIEGLPPAILINGRSLGVGDLVNDELEIIDIRPSEIDFYFRGVILTRVF